MRSSSSWASRSSGVCSLPRLALIATSHSEISLTNRSFSGSASMSRVSCASSSAIAQISTLVSSSSLTLCHPGTVDRSEEHTSELQSLMRTSYAVFCLKKKNKTSHTHEQLHPPTKQHPRTQQPLANKQHP